MKPGILIAGLMSACLLGSAAFAAIPAYITKAVSDPARPKCGPA